MIYEDFKMYGPYLRKDGRQHVVVVHPTKGKKTVSYPKYLIECKLGRYLGKDETVDHIDGNPLNNDFSNLRVLPRKLHASNDARRLKEMEFECLMCGRKFRLKGQQLHDRQSSRRKGSAGPFCSKTCSGKYGKYIQNGGDKFSSDMFNVEYEKLKDH